MHAFANLDGGHPVTIEGIKSAPSALRLLQGSPVALRLSVIGTGYLGATHAACMAELGYEVIGYDVDEAKIELLRAVLRARTT